MIVEGLPWELRLEEWLASGRATVVKQAPHRAVYRLLLPEGDFHLKRYPAAGRWFGGPSKARGEYERARAVAGRGVPTVTPVGAGEGEAGSFLLTRTLPGAVPLSAFLIEALPTFPARRRTLLRQRLAVALGGLLARMHGAGVTHADLHPGNLLLVLGPEDEPALYLIDLHAVRVGAPLGPAARAANLVVLNRWFILRATRADRLRCWRAYEAAGGDAGVGPGELERRTVASNLRFWREHDWRCLGGNRHFRAVRAGAVKGHAVADFDAQALLADPDAPFRDPGVIVLKNSPGSAVVEFDLPGGRRVVYKRFGVTGWADPWAALVRPTGALRSYMLGHGLRLRGLPTPRPLGVWHRVVRGLPREGYLLTEKVPGAVDLGRHVTSLAGLPAPERRAALRALIDQVAHLIRRLHEARLSHRDLKAPNLLVSPQGWVVGERGTQEVGGAAGPWVWFIDLVGVRRHRWLGRARRVQNLTRLHVSFHGHPGVTRADKLRFLRAYLGWGRHGKGEWKGWWRKAEAATASKVRRNAARGRPLG